MAKKNNAKEDSVLLYNKRIKVSKLVEGFVIIPSSEIVKYLKNKEIQIPLHFHKSLVKKNIAPVIASTKNQDRFSEEMKYRLRYFDTFTISQLENLKETYNIKVNVSEYKKDFWEIIVRNRKSLGINDLEFVKLQNLTMKYSKSSQETYEQMLDELSKLFIETNNYFDGTKYTEAKELLMNSATYAEIINIGKKYNVDVPRSINELEFIDIIDHKLHIDEQTKSYLKTQPMSEIEKYAKGHDIDIKPVFTKNEVIEYIMIYKDNEAKVLKQSVIDVFDNIDVEDYLYQLKFEEIAERMTSKKKKRMKNVQLIGLLVVLVLAAIGALFVLQ